jgi:myo-inositol-1(or 4)-monophosphatase
MTELEVAHRLAVDAAEAAGELLRGPGLAGAGTGMRVKDSTGDIVTDLDLAAEKMIIDRIRAVFPSHQIIAEESGLLDAAVPGTSPASAAPGGAASGAAGERTWLVDPLDGTNNLAIALPAYVVGIAMCAGDLPVLGVVHDPVARQTWSAVRDRGAFGPCGRLPCPPSRPAPYGPVLAWTQGHGVSREDATARALKLVLECTARRVLQLWAPLLAWVMLARGDIDGIVGYRAEAVDLPAGALIAAEAGLAVRGLDGQPFDERIGLSAADRSFVAGHPEDIGRLTGLVATARRIAPRLAKLNAVAQW